MTGNWTGSAQGITLALRLVQAGVSLSGSATTFGETFSVHGINAYPKVDFQGTMNGVLMAFDGTFSSPNTIAGVMTVLGTAIAITLDRQ